MKIAVLMKQVPLNNEVVFNADSTLDRAACTKGMNPADKCALLHAVSLAQTGDSVIALSMGPKSAAEMLLEAVALGASEGILLEDRAFAGSDTYATSAILASALQKMNSKAMPVVRSFRQYSPMQISNVSLTYFLTEKVQI